MVTLPVDLPRYEMLRRSVPPATLDTVLTEIVDDVFLPLVGATAGTPGDRARVSSEPPPPA